MVHRPVDDGACRVEEVPAAGDRDASTRVEPEDDLVLTWPSNYRRDSLSVMSMTSLAMSVT